MGDEKKSVLGQLGSALFGMVPGVAQTGIAGALGNWFGGMNDDRQYNQQQRLQELQLKGNKDMVNYNYAKQLEFWSKQITAHKWNK